MRSSPSKSDGPQPCKASIRTFRNRQSTIPSDDGHILQMNRRHQGKEAARLRKKTMPAAPAAVLGVGAEKKSLQLSD